MHSLLVVCLVAIVSGAAVVHAAGGDLCGAGYLSSSNRLWTFSKLPFLGKTIDPFLYTLNVCGGNGIPCDPSTAMCQISAITYSLGQRASPIITDIADTAIAVLFQKGDVCLSTQRNREISVLFVCSTSSEIYSVAEITPCNYTATIFVQDSFCQKASSTTGIPASVATVATAISAISATSGSGTLTLTSTSGGGTTGSGSYCGTGYLSSTNRLWNLAAIPELILFQFPFNYTLNLCGAYYLACGSDSVICQFDVDRPSWGPYSLGSVSKAVLTELSDTSIAVHFTGGNTCISPNPSRSVTLTLVCVTGNNAFSRLIETSACVYEGTVLVSEAPFCHRQQPATLSGTTHLIGAMRLN